MTRHLTFTLDGRRYDDVPEAWLAGRTHAREQAGLSPRDAVRAALNDWAEQVRFAELAAAYRPGAIMISPRPTIRRLDSGYWHVRFGRRCFVQWPQSRPPEPTDVCGVPLTLPEWALLEELVAAVHRGDIEEDA